MFLTNWKKQNLLAKIQASSLLGILIYAKIRYLDIIPTRERWVAIKKLKKNCPNAPHINLQRKF